MGLIEELNESSCTAQTSEETVTVHPSATSTRGEFILICSCSGN